MDEFTLINKYLKSLSKNNESALNLSDDIFFDNKNKVAISVDTFVEGIHFLDSNNPDKFLKKIFRASLSDLYCKGIKPNFYFLSFALNKKLVKPFWLNKVYKILKSEQKKFDVMLSGGDITASSKLVITITVLGYSKNKPVFRSKCLINDDIYVTGDIGDSYVGLNVIKSKLNFGKYNNFFKKKYYEPALQIKSPLYLNKIASSSIDISDGLGQDLSHLCQISRLGAFVNINDLPLSFQCRKLVNKKKISLTKIFSQGDDYQILFTSSAKNRSKIIFLMKKYKVKISRIGFIKKDKSMIFKYKTKEFKINPNKMGYIHNF